MKKTTNGEKLFYLIRDEILDQTSQRNLKWSNIGTLFDDVSGNQEFAYYIKGATSVFVMRRLLKFWNHERSLIADESRHVSRVSKFVKEVFPGLDDSSVSKLSRIVIHAEEASKKPIGSLVRTNLIRERKKLTCYLCGLPLDKNAKPDNDAHLTIEHLWPSSIGGDSIQDNLMPACKKCQVDTQDTAAWEWLNVHNFVISASSSELDINKKVTRKIRFAKHYYEATKLADLENLSLKAAFLRIGPIKTPLTHKNTGMPITFFDLNTF